MVAGHTLGYDPGEMHNIRHGVGRSESLSSGSFDCPKGFTSTSTVRYKLELQKYTITPHWSTTRGTTPKEDFKDGMIHLIGDSISLSQFNAALGW
jgi:hypothetical protein